MKYLAIALLFFALAACGKGGYVSGDPDFSAVYLVWEGMPDQSQDLREIRNEVANCLGVDIEKFAPVYIKVYSNRFPCGGYSLVNACSGKEIYMAENVLLESEGSLYAHELVHIFTHKDNSYHGNEDFRRCGGIRIAGFVL